jgi:thiol-disulfide isomerase/thioredoxin
MSATKILQLLIVLLFGGALSAGAEDGRIQWFQDLRKATEAALKNNQPILIDFWADWCAPCKIMDAEVYSNPAVIAALGQKVIAVRLNFDLQQEMVRRYNAEALPYLVFTNSYGTELMHHRGFLEAEDLTAVLRALPADVSELNRLDRILNEDKHDFNALLQMGKQLRSAGLYQSSNDYYARALKEDAAKKDARQREFVLLEMGANSLEINDGERAASVFERGLKEFPKSEKKPDFLLGLGRAYAVAGKKDKARKAWNALIREHPQSESSKRAQEYLGSL